MTLSLAARVPLLAPLLLDLCVTDGGLECGEMRYQGEMPAELAGGDTYPAGTAGG